MPPLEFVFVPLEPRELLEGGGVECDGGGDVEWEGGGGGGGVDAPDLLFFWACEIPAVASRTKTAIHICRMSRVAFVESIVAS